MSQRAELLGAEPASATHLRTYALDDLHIRSDGGGRVVEAYAAVFNTQAEVKDFDGHYLESLSPTSFNQTINRRGAAGFGVFYNHARTIDGASSGELSVPIGVPLEVKADGQGVWTATRYLDNPLADSVLDAIKQGAIKAQSFSGRFVKSTKTRPNRRGELPIITRNEVDMREYGPTVFPAYKEAAVTGFRAQFLAALAGANPDELIEMFKRFEITPPLAEEPVTSSGPVSTATRSADEPLSPSARQSLSQRIRAAKIARGME